ncbi:4839dbb4-6a0e-4598-92c5-2b747ae35c59 [Sclerotinia trifoliorum]|uniref:4839dbb4-6a0e-4598-92c5-2b747ae35c59 n=1 Tax=Sclerotinia trifoliorum TaxID=28548 RepID=A0A8H2VXH6_9HELO|nr:4839dbb4-6a0e-4598-92c5-2b747ae35c59 [Sclerotinia trifoliorum]
MTNSEDTEPKRAPAPHPYDDPPLSWWEIFRCSFPASGGFLFGYDAGYINGCLGMDYFKLAYGEPSNDPLGFQGYMYPTWAKSVITSLLSVGTFLGALASGYFSDKFGRRNTILIGCVIYCVGVVLQVAHPSIALLSAGRTIAGLGIGFVSANIVAFQTEICPKKIRGPCISVYQFGITIGLLIASGVNQATKKIQSNASFQIPIGLQFVFAAFLFSGLWLMLPESPRWFISKGRRDEAKHALMIMRGRRDYDPYLEREFDVMLEETREEMENAKGGWRDLFTGGFKCGSNLYRTFIGTTVQMMQQLTGVNFIFYYGTTYFAQVGLTGAFLLSTITNVVNVLSTPVSFWSIERFGRRPLLIYGAICMAVCEFIIAIVGSVLSENKAAQWVLFAFVCVHIFFFASTWGPTGWAVSGEMFPLALRGRGIALSTASNWLWNFVIAFVTPYLVGEENANLEAKVFYIFGGTCAISAVFAYFFIYETKGQSLESIDRMCADPVGKIPRKSAAWAKRRTGAAGMDTADTADSTGAYYGSREDMMNYEAVADVEAGAPRVRQRLSDSEAGVAVPKKDQQHKRLRQPRDREDNK